MPIAFDLSALDERLDDKVAIVTGGTSGVGFATAYELVSRGCAVVITGRTVERGEKRAKELQRMTGKGEEFIQFIPLVTNGPIKELANFVRAFRAKWDRLNIIVFNAGQSVFDDTKTIDNLCQWFVERLAYQHVLVAQFWDLLTNAGTEDFPSRVVTTTGFAYRWSKHPPSEWYDLIENAGVDGNRLDFPTFCVSQMGWTKCLAKACKDTNTPVYFLITHPGFVLDTGIADGCKKHCLLPALSCIIGSHKAKQACLNNVAACVLREPLLPQGGFLGPVKTTHGDPALIELEKEADSHDWKIFSEEKTLFDIGLKTLYELNVKIEGIVGINCHDGARDLEDFCERAGIFEERYRAYDDYKKKEASSWCDVL